MVIDLCHDRCRSAVGRAHNRVVGHTESPSWSYDSWSFVVPSGHDLVVVKQ